MKTLNSTKLNDLTNYLNYSFAQSFIDIIQDRAKDYDREADFLDNLKSFFEDLQKGGCISGMISEFIYHADTKAFYIEHLDDLEEFKSNLEDNLGEQIKNRHRLPHYTFLVWLCFEEFCYDLYNTIFEN